MTNINTNTQPSTRGFRRIAWAAALGIACTFSLPLAAQAQIVTPPPVPTEIEVLPPNVPFLLGRGVGTQNYSCQPVDSLGHVDWVLFTPQATLFSDQGEQLITHFSSPNPDENSFVRVTWQDSLDTSSVWARATGVVTVKSNAIPWVRLEVVGRRVGPTGGNTLTGTTFIQRVNTEGGLAPSTGCDQPVDAGKKAFMPYTADYFFYKRN